MTDETERPEGPPKPGNVQPEDRELPNMRIGGTEAGISSENTKFPLGRVVLWGVKESLIPWTRANEIAVQFHQPLFEQIKDYTAACRAVRDLEETRGTKPDWDLSGYVTSQNQPQPEGKRVFDTIVYGVKSVPGQEFILHRTIYRTMRWEEDGVKKEKTQRVPENIARIYHSPAKHKQVQRQKVCTQAAFVSVGEYNMEHPILGIEGLNTLEAHVKGLYRKYQDNIVAEDIRRWLKASMKQMDSHTLRPATIFIPWEHQEHLKELRHAVLELVNNASHTGSGHSTHMEFLEVENVEAKRKWIAESVERESANKFKKMFNEVAKLLEDAEKVPEVEAREKRKMKILDDYVEDLNTDAEYRGKFVRVLQRKIDLCLDFAQGNEEEEQAAGLVGVNTARFSLIADAIKRSKVSESISDIFKGALPSEGQIVGETGRNLRIAEDDEIQ